MYSEYISICVLLAFPKFCDTEDCKSASQRLLKNMDLKSDPCEDFNQFSCGKFIREMSIPEDKTEIDAFTPVTDERRLH